MAACKKIDNIIIKGRLEETSSNAPCAYRFQYPSVPYFLGVASPGPREISAVYTQYAM